MPVENITPGNGTIFDLRVDWPIGASDLRSTSDDSQKAYKNAIRNSFPDPGVGYAPFVPAAGWTGTNPVTEGVPALEGRRIPGLGAFQWRGGLVVPSQTLGIGAVIATFPGTWGVDDRPLYDTQQPLFAWPNYAGTPTFVAFGISFTADGEIKAFPPALGGVAGGYEGNNLQARSGSWNWGGDYLYFFGSGTVYR